MKRKMVVIGISYILGLFFASFFSHLWLLVLMAAAGLFLVLMAVLHRLEKRVTLTALIFFFAGIFLYTNYTVQVYEPIAALQGVVTEFTGTVKSFTVYDNDFTVYVLDGAFRNGTEASVVCTAENFDCRFGDMLTISGSFSVPEQDYLYDSTQYYQGKSVFLQADSDCTYTVSYEDGYDLVRRLFNYREKIQRRIYAVGGKTGGSLSVAMIFGMRSGLDSRLENAFYHAGIGPMLSVSGFHLVLFTSFCNLIGRRTRLQRMLQFGMTVILVVLFSLVAMWPVSVLRAGLMLLIARSACIFCRRGDGLNSLCIAVMILTAIRPYLIHDAGFLLSVTGTFGINVFAPWMTAPIEPKHWYGVLGKMVLMNMLVTLCTMPICICCFSETSLLAPISNVLFSPMCIILMVCAILIFFCGGAPVISELCGYVIDCVGTLLSDCLLWMKTSLPVSFPLGWERLPQIAFVLCGIICLSFLLLRSRNAIYFLTAGSVLVLSAAQYFHHREFWKEPRLFVLGHCGEQVAVITYNGRTDVIDLTGDHRNADYLLTFLTRTGISHISALYMLQETPAMAASYDDALYGVTVDTVISAHSSAARSQDTICGQPVHISGSLQMDAGWCSISAAEGQLTLTAEGGTVQIQKRKPKEDTVWDSDFMLFGLRYTKVLCTPEGYAEDTAECAAEAIELIFHENGSISVRRMT